MARLQFQKLLRGTATPEGFEISPFDPDFKEAMEAAAVVAKEYKNALRTLAQK